jgi:hypothetical protein
MHDLAQIVSMQEILALMRLRGAAINSMTIGERFSYRC